jgi:Rha family phage regulatory protein
MNNIMTIPANSTSTISSLEIAEMTGKEHRNVTRDIRTMLEELGEGGVLRFEHTYKNQQNGQEYPVFHLPKRESLCLAAGYDVVLRMRIIDKWSELESIAQVPIQAPVPIVDSDLVRASQELTAVMTPLSTLFTAMGLSKAEKCKAMVQHAMTIGPKHGVGNSLIPDTMAKYLPTGKSHSTVAMASTGGEIVDVTTLGKLLGHTAAQVNDALVWLKFQARVKLGTNYYWVKLPPADAIADEKMQGPKSRHGGYTPTKIIKGWRENLVYPHLQRAFTQFPGGVFK